MSAPNNRVEQSGCADRHPSCFERVAHGRTEPVGATTSGVASKMLPPVEHYDRAVPAQGAIEAEFGHGPQTLRGRRISHLAAGERVDEEPGFEYRYGFGDRTGEFRIVERHYVEGAMELHMMQLDCRGPAQDGKRRPTGRGHSHGLRTGRRQPCDAEAEEVRKAGMGADSDPRSLARSSVRYITLGSPAWTSQATLADNTQPSIVSSAPRSQSPKLSAIGASRSIRRAPAGVRRPAGALHQGRPGCRAWRG
jgi:hypothetical protein